jgi:hypothetical protein
MGAAYDWVWMGGLGFLVLMMGAMFVIFVKPEILDKLK